VNRRYDARSVDDPGYTDTVREDFDRFSCSSRNVCHYRLGEIAESPVTQDQREQAIHITLIWIAILMDSDTPIPHSLA
jgi:hypothetical protein